DDLRARAVRALRLGVRDHDARRRRGAPLLARARGRVRARGARALRHGRGDAARRVRAEPRGVSALEVLEARVIRCRRCPRLVAWREAVAESKRRAFRDEVYWGRPLPAFGKANARLVVVGLAPAAHGGNRTGRMFTGDR